MSEYPHPEVSTDPMSPTLILELTLLVFPERIGDHPRSWLNSLPSRHSHEEDRGNRDFMLGICAMSE
jgi:hypothetical protein